MENRWRKGERRERRSSCLHAKIVERKGGVEEERRTNCTFLASIGKIGVTAWVFFAQIFFFFFGAGIYGKRNLGVGREENVQDNHFLAAVSLSP